jgi:hypothetical protein
MQSVFSTPSWSPAPNNIASGHQPLAASILAEETDLSGHTQARLDKIALRLNQRPRKTLRFQTPASKLQGSVASTA